MIEYSYTEINWAYDPVDRLPQGDWKFPLTIDIQLEQIETIKEIDVEITA